MRRLAALVALALGTLLLLAACHGGGSSTLETPLAAAPTQEETTIESPEPSPTIEPTTPTPAPTEAEPAEVDACELLTEEFVGRVTGQTVESVDRGLGGEGGPKDVCYYHFDEFSEVILRVTIPFSDPFEPSADDGEAYYDRVAFGEEISGLGDRANWNDGARTLLVLQDGNAIEVAISPSVLPGASGDVLFEIAKSMAVEAMFSGILPTGT